MQRRRQKTTTDCEARWFVWSCHGPSVEEKSEVKGLLTLIGTPHNATAIIILPPPPKKLPTKLQSTACSSCRGSSSCKCMKIIISCGKSLHKLLLYFSSSNPQYVVTSKNTSYLVKFTRGGPQDVVALRMPQGMKSS